VGLTGGPHQGVAAAAVPTVCVLRAGGTRGGGGARPHGGVGQAASGGLGWAVRQPKKERGEAAAGPRQGGGRGEEGKKVFPLFLIYFLDA
jgi:hypothetical protein